MPMSAEKIAKRAQIHEDSDLEQLAIGQEIDLAAKSEQDSAFRVTPNSRMIDLLKRIYDIFTSVYDEKNRICERIEATEFNWLEDPEAFPGGRCFSHPSVIKAKKLLGIRSVRLTNKWYWTFPRRAPTEVQEKMHKQHRERFIAEHNEYAQKLKSQRLTASSRELIDFLQDHNYDVLGSAVLESLSFNRRTIMRIKAKLGVASIKRSDGWHWVYPAPVVQEWLTDELASGPRGIGDLIVEGSKRGWSDDVVRMAARAVGVVHAVGHGIPELRGRGVWRLR